MVVRQFQKTSIMTEDYESIQQIKKIINQTNDASQDQIQHTLSCYQNILMRMKFVCLPNNQNKIQVQ